MSQLMPFQPSLASATNTRVDSACKHIQQCRVSTDDLLQYTENRNDQETLQREKYRYCIHKDECVVGIGRAWNPQLHRKRVNNAYPRVISNLGQLQGAPGTWSEAPISMIRYMFHYARSIREKKAIIKWFESRAYHTPSTINLDTLAIRDNQSPAIAAFKPDPANAAQCELNFGNWLNIMVDYIPVGFANTLGWAHSNSGDTMSSVMIGGLRTVMNGDFEVFTGDLIMWYWPCERDCFEDDGSRKPYIGSWKRAPNGDLLPPNVDPRMTMQNTGRTQFSERELPEDAQERQVYHARQFGAPPSKEKLVARVKPFFRDDENPRMYDFYRVFGVAISCARPHEMLDIKIQKQSL